MKQLIGYDVGSYIFNPAARTITLVNIPPINLEQILTVVNTTDGIMIYCFADPSLGGSEANNVLTVNYNTSAMASTDNLQIYIDLPGLASSDQAMLQNQQDMLWVLRRLCHLIEPISIQDASQRQRVVVDAGTITTVGTVSTITGGTITTITNAVGVGNVATLGSQDPNWIFRELARTSYSDGIRRNLTFS